MWCIYAIAMENFQGGVGGGDGSDNLSCYFPHGLAEWLSKWSLMDLMYKQVSFENIIVVVIATFKI